MSSLGMFILLIVLIGSFIAYVKLSTKKAKKENKETWLMRSWKKDSTKSVASSLISILCGMLVGCVILLISYLGKIANGSDIYFSDVINGIQLLFLTLFNTGNAIELRFTFNTINFGNMLFNATPLILTGLSVALAFKTGLFNIGAPGQYLVGTAASLIISLSIPSTILPVWLIWTLAFLGAILAGAIWGLVPGLFKSLFNVNEVITCIMMNWIAANFVTSLFGKSFRNLLDPSGTKNWKFVYKTTHNGVATNKMGLDVLFKESQVNGGIIIAILIAILVYIMLNKTTFGYELKACGSNKNAAKYAGINEKRSIILSMMIAGGLAGAGAALYYLAGNTEFSWSTYESLPAVGFNGIPAALLAVSNPIGVIFSALFMAYLSVAGNIISGITEFSSEITNIISAVIVYFSAFALVIKELLNNNKKRKKEKPLDVQSVVVSDTKEVSK